MVSTTEKERVQNVLDKSLTKPIFSVQLLHTVAKCCANKNSGDDTFIPFDLCSELDVDAVLSSRNWLYGQRKLQFIDDGEIAALSNSKYELGDGIFVSLKCNTAAIVYICSILTTL